ncbi:ATP-binding protein [Salinibacterium sp. G-O1]|uniref:AAA family ATPase n=1 Tax=Salinibacterium sp. G-O1 TaxID=3046208 RepID=UPI0024BBA965|nr:ATP-binding protein [Salinibacterium sp. G-O1]MDJ0334686.1 ATP-binding protein [Salinibacterium sp. G-O1]
MAGLPGSGKSTMAQVLGARLQLPVISVDPIEEAILKAGIDIDQPTGLAAYLVAEMHADTTLAAGRSVIIDAVNAVNPAREQWINLALRRNEQLRFIEVVCTDPEVHRERIENRERQVPHQQLTWHAVEQSLEDYAEWSGSSAGVARITLDSTLPFAGNLERALAFLES